MGPPPPAAAPLPSNRHHRRANSFSGNATTSSASVSAASSPTRATNSTRRTSTTTTTPNRYRTSTTASNLKLLGTTKAAATSKTPPRSSSKTKATAKTPPRSSSKIAYKPQAQLQQHQNRTPNRGGRTSATTTPSKNTPSRLSSRPRGMTPQQEQRSPAPPPQQRRSSIPPRQQQRSPAPASTTRSRPRSPVPSALQPPPPPVRTEDDIDEVFNTAAASALSSNNNSKGEGGGALQVAIRMRPLNDKESTDKKIWKVVTKNNAIAQIDTQTGEVVAGKYCTQHNNRNYFVYDKAFDSTVSTQRVYQQTCQQIVQSTTRDGKNGTIFAYGQTSSGKTYTMQGAGRIEEVAADGATSNGGILHLAASDIFNYIDSNSDQRKYDVKTSFVEVYNEEVRDLLSDGAKVSIREDNVKGVFVECKEMEVNNYAELLNVLSRGDKSRSFASTAMNDRSSRSHTIFRITIESRNKRLSSDDKDRGDNNNIMNGDASSDVEEDDIGDDDDDDGTVLVSTLNLVDLAGSESVRLTGATGERQKEGGMINTSLLTLSLVIEKLGNLQKKSSAGHHVPFRDSNLTRILQPSLSGNARMAVICCATPSDRYFEETRSTLQFASRAKLVKTNAQSNEVLDDEGMIRKLKRELALTKRLLVAANGGEPIVEIEEMRKLRTDAATADKRAQLYRTMYEHLFQSQNQQQQQHLVSETAMVLSSPTNTATSCRKRRLSDGVPSAPTTTTITAFTSSTEVKLPASEPRCRRPGKARKTIHEGLSPGSELSILKSSVVAKNRSIVVHQQMQEAKDSELGVKLAELQSISADQKVLESTIDQLLEDKTNLQKEVDNMSQKADQLSTEKAELAERLASMEREKDELASKLSESEKKHTYTQGLLDETDNELESTIEKLESVEDEKASIEKKQADAMAEVQQLRTDLGTSHQDAVTLRSRNADLESKLSKSSSDIDGLSSSLESVQVDLQKQQDLTSSVELENTSLKSAIETYKLDATSMHESVELCLTEQSVAQESIRQLQSENNVVSNMLSDQTLEVGTLKKYIESLNADLSKEQERSTSLEGSSAMLSTEVMTYKKKVEELQQQSTTTSNELSTVKESFKKLEGEKDEIAKELSEAQSAKEKMVAALSKTSEELTSTNEKVIELEGNYATLLESHEKTLSSWESSKSHLEAAHQRINHLEASVESSEKAKQDYDSVVNQLRCNIQQVEASLSSTKQELSISNEAVETLEGEVDSLSTDLQQMEGIAESACSEANVLKETLTCTENKASELESKIKDLQVRNESALGKVSTLEYEKLNAENHSSSLESSLQECHDQLQATTAELTAIKVEQGKAVNETKQLRAEMEDRKDNDMLIAELRSKIQAYQKKENELADENTSLLVEKSTLQAKLNVQQSTLESHRAEEETLLARLQETEARLSSAESQKNELSNKLSGTEEDLQDKIEELLQANDQFEDTNNRLNQFRQTINDLRDEVESKSAMVSQSVSKENEQLATISEHERTIKMLKQELEVVQAATSTSSVDSPTVLMALEKKANHLETENSELKQRLATTNETIKSAQEAESVTKLRLDETTKKLNHVSRLLSEREAALSETRSIQNEHSSHYRTEIKSLKRELEIERANHARSEKELKDRMGEERRALMQEAHHNLQNLRRELNLVQDSLKESNNKAHAAGLENVKLTDAIGKLEIKVVDKDSDLSRKQEAISMLQQKIAQAKEEERNVEKLKEDNQQLSLEVKQLQSDIQRRRMSSSTRANKENGTDNDLQHKVDELLEEISLKDQRIVKLEKVKMKQEFLESFKDTKNKLQESKKQEKQYEKLVTELRQQLDEANAVCREDSETTTLRFDKQALENQLRKKANECQNLEDERARVLKVLRANKRSSSTTTTEGSDMTKAIVHLCDHAASLEKECESFKNWGNRNELEIVKQENSVLRSQLNECKKMVEASRRSESEQLQLKRDAENAGADNNREVRCLENENLQLMADLKETKMKYRQVQKELNALRIKGTDDTTIIMHQTKSQRKTPSKQRLPPSTRSHVSDNSPSGFAQKPPKRGESHQRKHGNQTPSLKHDCIMSNNENTANVPHKKAVDTLSSKSDSKRIGSHRKEKQRQRVPGFGEAGVPDDEGDTQQCQQS